MNHFDQIQSEFDKVAAKKPMRKRTVKKQKQQAEEARNFLKEKGKQLVSNPSPKAKKKTVLIESLLHGDQAQKSLFQRLYKTWKGTGGISSVTRDIKQKEKSKAEKAKHRTQIESERAKRKEFAQEALEEKRKRQEAERKLFDKEKELETLQKIDKKIESSSSVKQVEQLSKKEQDVDEFMDQQVEKNDEKLIETGDKSDELYQKRLENIRNNKSKLTNNIDVFKDPPPPKQVNHERLKFQLDKMNEALQSLKISDQIKQVNVVNSPNFTTVQFKTTNSDFKANKLDQLVEGRASDAISSFIKQEGVSLRKNVDETKDFDFSILIPKGIDIKDRDIVSFKELLTSNEFLEQRAKNSAGLIVPIGRDTDNKVQTVDLSVDNNVIIDGGIGSGKTVNMHNIINTIQYSYTPEEQQLIVIDPKNVEMKRYKNSKYLALPLITGGTSDSQLLQEVHAVLDRLASEHQRRKTFLGNIQEMTGKSFDNINDWNAFLHKSKNNDLNENEKKIFEKIPEDQRKLIPRLNLCIDEFLTLIVKDKTYMETTKSKGLSVVDHLITTLAESRATGIGVIACTQSYKKEFIPGSLHNFFKGKIVGRVSDPGESKQLLMPGVHKLLPKGDVMYSGESRSDMLRVQSGRALPDELDAAAEKVSGEQHFMEQTKIIDFSKEKSDIEIAKKQLENEEYMKQIRQRVDESMSRFKDVERESQDIKQKYEPLRKQIQQRINDMMTTNVAIEEERLRRKQIEDYETNVEKDLNKQYKDDEQMSEDDEQALEDSDITEPKTDETEPESDEDATLQKEIAELTKPVSRKEVETKSKEELNEDKKIEDAERASEGRVTEDYTKDMEKKKKSILDRLMSLTKRKKSE